MIVVVILMILITKTCMINGDDEAADNYILVKEMTAIVLLVVGIHQGDENTCMVSNGDNSDYNDT